MKVKNNNNNKNKLSQIMDMDTQHSEDHFMEDTKDFQDTLDIAVMVVMEDLLVMEMDTAVILDTVDSMVDTVDMDLDTAVILDMMDSEDPTHTQPQQFQKQQKKL